MEKFLDAEAQEHAYKAYSVCTTLLNMAWGMRLWYDAPELWTAIVLPVRTARKGPHWRRNAANSASCIDTTMLARELAENAPAIKPALQHAILAYSDTSLEPLLEQTLRIWEPFCCPAYETLLA